MSFQPWIGIVHLETLYGVGESLSQERRFGLQCSLVAAGWMLPWIGEVPAIGLHPPYIKSTLIVEAFWVFRCRMMIWILIQNSIRGPSFRQPAIQCRSPASRAMKFIAKSLRVLLATCSHQKKYRFCLVVCTRFASRELKGDPLNENLSRGQRERQWAPLPVLEFACISFSTTDLEEEIQLSVWYIKSWMSIPKHGEWSRKSPRWLKEMERVQFEF